MHNLQFFLACFQFGQELPFLLKKEPRKKSFFFQNSRDQAFSSPRMDWSEAEWLNCALFSVFDRRGRSWRDGGEAIDRRCWRYRCSWPLLEDHTLGLSWKDRQVCFYTFLFWGLNELCDFLFWFLADFDLVFDVWIEWIMWDLVWLPFSLFWFCFSLVRMIITFSLRDFRKLLFCICFNFFPFPDEFLCPFSPTILYGYNRMV